MADFKAGDRVVKMSGTGAGKYGTVNSVMDNGTLNVTFDGERLPRYCDPMRCGQVATNAKFSDGTMLDTGIKVKKTRGLFGDTSHIGKVGTAVRVYDEGGEGAAVMVRYPGSTELFEEDSRTLVRVNSRAANAVARNGDYDIEKFEVGKVYRAPWDRDWLAKVLSRTPSSIKVAIKSARDKTWHGADEQVTLRINPRKSEEQGAEVAKGWDWEFWADVKA